MPSQHYHLPKNLPFPITITSFVAQPHSKIQRNSTLLHYSYIYVDKKKSQKRFGTWEASFQGKIENWNFPLGKLITRDEASSRPALSLEQECSHELQYGGLCLMCREDLTIDPDYNSSLVDDSRTMVPMTHTANGPLASKAEAKRIINADNQRLLTARKLSLIVDLDQTIVHATVDPTVGEWITEGHAYESRLKNHQAKKEKRTHNDNDSNDEGDSSSDDSDDDHQPIEEPNPNWEALKDVSKFKLGPDFPMGPRTADADTGCDYYVKPRPGLDEFLKKLSEIYEMHVYTMGTRAYAEKVCSVIDPDKHYFNDRILSRDDSGSLTQKSIERLFPCDDSMVVIIDDRSDVWQNSVNLVKVIPYDFFVGIGDINATFLPKNTDPLNTTPTPLPASSSEPEATPSSVPSTLPTEGVMVTKQEVETALAAEAQSKAVEAQLEQRPLAKMQEALDEEEPSDSPVRSTTPPAVALNGVTDSQSDPSSTPSSSPGDLATLVAPSDSEPSPSPPPSSKHRGKPLLKNDDVELDRVFKILSEIHERFYDEHEAVTMSFKDSGISDAKADVKVIISEMKKEVFLGVHILFSGVIPTNISPEAHPAWRFAKEFGARCHTKLTSEVTHLVANKPGTDKVMQALRKPNIKVVWAKWFYMCIALWNCIPITDEYLLENPSKSNRPTSTNTPSSMNATTAIGNGPGPSTEGIASNPPSPPTNADDEDNAESDIMDDEGGGDVDLNPGDDVWKSLDKELEDFMDEEDGESVAGSVVSVRRSRAPSRSLADFTSKDMEAIYASADEDMRSPYGSSPSSPYIGPTKRRRSTTPSGSVSGNGTDDGTRSPLSKRKKLAQSRGSSRLKKHITMKASEEEKAAAHEQGVIDPMVVTKPKASSTTKQESESDSNDSADDSDDSDDEAPDEMRDSMSDDEEEGKSSDGDDLFAGIGDDEWG